MTEIIAIPLGWIMHYCYNFVNNYGMALVLFTLVTKIAMLPFAVSQQKNTVKMVILKPRMDEIQEKYKNDQVKMQEELQALYTKENYDMLSSCLPMLIQFPIMFGLINVIYNPLKHILQIPAETRTAAIEIMKTVLAEGQMNKYSQEISVITAFQQAPAAFASLGQEFSNLVGNFDFTFLGIDLGQIPKLSFASKEAVMLLMIPVLSALATAVSSYLAARNNPNAGGGAAAGTNAAMVVTMPLMSLWISFSVPAGVAIYWMMSNVFSVVQQIILNKIYNPREVAEKIKKEIEEEKEKERKEKAEAKKRVKEKGGEISEEEYEKSLSQKEINRRKLAAARKRDAEKYGEEYVEVTDKDVD